MPLRYLAELAMVVAMPAAAEDSYKIGRLDEPPPAALAAGVKDTLGARVYRVTDPGGKSLVDIWLRERTPAAAMPSGPKGAVLYPILAEGELIGAVRFAAEGHDYRDQTIAPGVYTLRYGLQPVNGDHLGVSVNRDYVLLVPAASDTGVADLPPKKLGVQSAEAAGTTHPAVLLLLAPPAKPPDGPSMVNDAMLNTWGAIVALPLEVKGEPNSVPLPMQIVVVGAKTD